MIITHMTLLFSSHRTVEKNHYNILHYKTWESPKPLLPVQLDHCHKPSGTRRLLRGHSREKIPCLLPFTEAITRGVVEDKRLEAKAKDTKKNSRRRPRTSFPRTDLLEAKDRNTRGQGQGPSAQAQVFSKKRSSKKFFRQSPVYRRSQIF